MLVYFISQINNISFTIQKLRNICVLFCKLLLELKIPKCQRSLAKNSIFTYFQLLNYTPAVVSFYFLVAYPLVFVWSILIYQNFTTTITKKIKLVQCKYQLTTDIVLKKLKNWMVQGTELIICICKVQMDSNDTVYFLNVR